MAGKKGKNLTAIIVIAAITVIAGIIILAWLAGKPPEMAAREVKVYFSDEDGILLKAEKHKIDKGDIASEAKAAVEVLMGGPENISLGNPIPQGTSLLSFKLDGSTAIVDLSPEVIQNHSGGSSGELQTVYSIVNTITLNFPQIKDVQILVGGKKTETIAGHIDITLPLGPDTKFIKG